MPPLKDAHSLARTSGLWLPMNWSDAKANTVVPGMLDGIFTMPSDTGHLDQAVELAGANIFYRERGYVVIRGLISQLMIDDLLRLYQRQIIPSLQMFFRQSTNVYEANRFSGNGHVLQSFLDIHDYRDYPEFSESSRRIFCCTRLMGALRRITGFTDFNLMQTMLFDQNTGTPPHQDRYYLDSVPNGHGIATWIALEDIDERAGRFYVLPKSHKVDFSATARVRSHAEWLAEIRSFTDDHRSEIVAPALQAGDILFFNSGTIHGSLPTQDERYSRKSLTAHYLPSHLAFGNLFTVKTRVRYRVHDGIKFYRNQPDYSVLNGLRFRFKARVYNFPRLREGIRTLRGFFTGEKPL